MNKLLSAGLTRLKKSTVFWTLTLIMAAMGLYFPITLYYNMQKYNVTYTPENSFFFYIMTLGILLAVFCSLFIGTEYSDGTIRNKLVVGHGRIAIYLSNLILCCLAGMILVFVYIAANLCVSLPLLGTFQIPYQQLLVLILFSLAVLITYTAIFTMAAMLIQNKAISAVVVILSAFLLLMMSSYIQAKLEQPEYYENYTMGPDGEVTKSEPVLNEFYLRGAKRQTYEFLLDFLPSGQSMLLTFGECSPFYLLYDGIIILITTGAGIVVFFKKDIK